MKRRDFLRGAATWGAASSVAAGSLSLSGCASFFDAFAGTCPTETERSTTVTWAPDIYHPVLAASRDYGPADGAPMPVRIFYPTDDTSFFPNSEPKRMLKQCVVRWPIVLFLHGQPPQAGGQCSPEGLYRRWTTLPQVLARSGYVVAVPDYRPQLPAETAPDPGLLRLLDWLREPPAPVSSSPSTALAAARVAGGLRPRGWEHSKWVDADATAVAGHSWGALQAARIAVARPAISSFVSLGGGFNEILDPTSLLSAIPATKFFAWGEAAPTDENLDTGAGTLWNAVQPTKYAAVHKGGHYDYLQPWSGCDFGPVGCPELEAVMADLVAQFIARYTPVKYSRAKVPLDLKPPFAFFPSGERLGAPTLQALRAHQANNSGKCRISLRWEEQD